MQFPVGVALRDLANFAADQVTRAISQTIFKSFLLWGRSTPLRFVSSKYVFLTAKQDISVLVWQNRENKNKKREKWQEREGRVVNLQTVVFNMLSLSCDSRANIMVSLCLTQWEFWQHEAITHNKYNRDY